MKRISNSFGLAVTTALYTSLLMTSFAQAQSSTISDSSNPQYFGCYYIKSLNNNFQSSNPKWLGIVEKAVIPNSSDGATVQGFQTMRLATLVDNEQHFKKGIWRLVPTNQGYLIRNEYWLDGASDGKTVKMHYGKITHGGFWEIEKEQGGYRFRSLNNNFKEQNFHWLDGASDGKTVQLVNGKSHGTLWEMTSISCSGVD